MNVKLYFGEAFNLILKTMPFIWVRLGSYLLLGLALGIYFGVLGGVAWLLSSLWAPLGIIMFIIAIAGGFGVMRWASRYYFYLLKAAHTAVMTEFIVYGKGPSGSQISYGKQQVTNRFRDTSAMFAIDVLVDGTVKALTRTVTNIANILPIPGLESLGALFRRVALASTTYVDESILSRAYAKREDNVWKVAQDGVVLYAQAWKPILANAVALAVLGMVEFVLLLIILGLPAVALGAAFPALRVALGVGVIILAWMIKLAVADAFAMATTLIAYHRATAQLEPNAEWVARLEGMSKQFQTLTQKARAHAEPPVTPAPTPATPLLSENA